MARSPSGGAGDAATIRRHLEALTHDDAAVSRARERRSSWLRSGMDKRRGAVAAALATDLPPVMRSIVD